MLLQAVIRVCLEILEYFNIGSLDLSIALWMPNRCATDMDVEVFAVFLKYSTGELGPLLVMILFGTLNLKIIDLINLTVDCLLILTTRAAFGHFVNLSMVTYMYQYPPMALANGHGMSNTHTVNGHEGEIICSICAGVWICLA
jgi:hypothetical protein